MRQYMLERYHRRRSQYIAQLGGQCIDCGTTEDLQFDHIIAAEKSFSVAKFWSYAEGRVAEELKKCVLRCGTHHRLKSVRVGDIPTVEHGGGVSGKRNCSCDLCKAKKKKYMKEYKRRRGAVS